MSFVPVVVCGLSGLIPCSYILVLGPRTLLKYSPGGKYEIHTDHYTDAPRHLSIILNLNQDYEGGDLVFTDQRENEVKRLKLKERTIVFFPSNFMYPHTIEPITKGIRKSLVVWVSGNPYK